MARYFEQKYERLRNVEKHNRIFDSIYVSCITGLSLSEYITAQAAHVLLTMLNPAKSVMLLQGLAIPFLRKDTVFFLRLSKKHHRVSNTLQSMPEECFCKCLLFPFVSVTLQEGNHYGDVPRYGLF